MLENLFSEGELEKLKDSMKKNKPIKIYLNKEVLRKVYTLNDLNDFLNNHLLVYPYVNLTNFKNTTCKHDFTITHKDVHFTSLENRVSKVALLYRIAKGDTLIVKYLQYFHKSLRELTYYLGNLFNSNCNINLYYSYKGKKGINLHFDYHDVLVLQIHGEKYWKIINEKGDIGEKISKSFKPDLRFVKKEDILEFKTEFGESLYIPKGYWHFAYTKDSTSLHLAVGLKPLRIKDVIKYVLNKKLDNIGEENLYELSSEIFRDFVKEILNKVEKEISDVSVDELLKFLKEREERDFIIELV